MSKLPEMTVELRQSTTAHGLKPPTMPGDPGWEEQIEDFFILLEGAKEEAPWSLEVRRVLKKHAPFELSDIESSLKAFGFNSWRECVDFVKDDECIEFMVRVAHWAKKNNFEVRTDRGFIDGEGVGLYKRWADRTDRTLEKIFDAKYYFQAERPLVYLNNALGCDCTPLMNYIHPGHWRYPAGHGGKFYESADLGRDTWVLQEWSWFVLLTGSYVLSMARTGGGVHLPEDNIAAGALAGLSEFDAYKE